MGKRIDQCLTYSLHDKVYNLPYIKRVQLDTNNQNEDHWLK